MNKTNLSELFALPIGMKEIAKIEQSIETTYNLIEN